MTGSIVPMMALELSADLLHTYLTNTSRSNNLHMVVTPFRLYTSPHRIRPATNCESCFPHSHFSGHLEMAPSMKTDALIRRRGR